MGGWDIGWNGVEWIYFCIFCAVIMFGILVVIYEFIKAHINRHDAIRHRMMRIRDDD